MTDRPTAVHVVDTGFIVRHPGPAAPRVAVLPDGHMVASYVTRSGGGTPDYAIALAGSSDGGTTWTARGPVWPDDVGRWSVAGSISAGADGELLLYGTQTPVASDGSGWWDPERGALAANDLFWSRSFDGGRSWTARAVIPMPIAGSAEAPGPLLVTRRRRWLVTYAPYPTFDPTVEVDRAQVLALRSDDRGATWASSVMLHLGQDGGTAEAGAVELPDGRLFGSCWGMDVRTGHDRPNPWAVSDDGGATWSPTRSTGLAGQAIGMAVLPDGRVALAYNQRDPRRPPVGVWLAVLSVDRDEVTVTADEPVWAADEPVWAAGGDDAAQVDPIGHDAWQTYTFGEPGVALLPDGELLVTIWSGVADRAGVVWVRTRVT